MIQTSRWYPCFFLSARPGLLLLVCALCLIVAGAAWWSGIAAASPPSQPYLRQVFAQDLDPAATYPRFARVEELISHLIVETDASAPLSAADAVALLEAVAAPLAMPGVPVASVGRAAFLIEKSLPDTRGHWLAGLLEGYVCYLRQRATLRLPAEELPAGQPPQFSLAAQLYAEEVIARDACLGAEVSRTLFAEQDRLTQLLLQRGTDNLSAAADRSAPAMSEQQRSSEDGR